MNYLLQLLCIIRKHTSANSSSFSSNCDNNSARSRLATLARSSASERCRSASSNDACVSFNSCSSACFALTATALAHSASSN
ncbi:hypothetical protein WN51_02713 [Melipona quadrifasciata]|uniref:Uncharacterized protein n=1 Tax=Melipona quadrifasciata TaxID=166423 RepID=A0A0N0BJS5_9HYME|nr:hypothetical protein WN51_02713 [Melipona quadrifasciata]